ncbi:hypothetical protein [Pediococcus damnosus]|nr:hypothetical protein [Pediococcus damnosus]
MKKKVYKKQSSKIRRLIVMSCTIPLLSTSILPMVNISAQNVESSQKTSKKNQDVKDAEQLPDLSKKVENMAVESDDESSKKVDSNSKDKEQTELKNDNNSKDEEQVENSKNKIASEKVEEKVKDKKDARASASVTISPSEVNEWDSYSPGGLETALLILPVSIDASANTRVTYGLYFKPDSGPEHSVSHGMVTTNSVGQATWEAGAWSEKESGNYIIRFSSGMSGSTSARYTYNKAEIPTVASHTISAGVSVTFTAENINADHVAEYQWQKRERGQWADIEGATNRTYRTDGTDAVGTTEYRVTVKYGTDNVLTKTSNAATLTVTGITPTIADQSVLEGQKATFKVEEPVSGVHYQWLKKDGDSFEPISGATSSTYTTNGDEADGTQYKVKATSGSLVDESNVATLTVAELMNPEIENQEVLEGQKVTFTSEAVAGVNYQWQQWIDDEWKNIDGATNHEYETKGTEADQSKFRVRVNNGYINKYSDEAVLTVTELVKPEVADETVLEGQKATFTTEAVSGVSYQWQQLIDGDWENIAGATNHEYETKGTEADQSKFRVRANNGHINKYSNEAVLTVTELVKPTVADKTVLEGEKATFATETVSGVSYQWQQKVDGDWENIDGADKNEYETKGTEADQSEFRVKANNGHIDKYSDAAVLTVTELAKPEVADKTALEGQKATFTTEAVSGVSYQWQQLIDGDWENIDGATKHEYETKGTESDQSKFRVRANNGHINKYSNEAVLTVTELVKPTVDNETVLEGQKAIFTTKAVSGVSYQWQQLIDGDWENIDDADKNEYETKGTEADQSEFRVIADNGHVTKTSNAASLTVKELAKPSVADETVLEGQKATFSTEKDADVKSYHWQQKIDGDWKDIDGADKNEYTTEGTEADQSEFRVIVDNGYITKTSETAKLTVKELAKPTVADETVLEGQKATFTTKGGSTAKSYQWQQKIDGDWKDIDGADKNEYTTEGTEADQSEFRVIVDNGYVTKTSETAKLTVKELAKPEVADETVLEGQKATFKTKADPTTESYQWQQLIDDEWKDIDGADKAEYTTDGTDADQSKFRVNVDNGHINKYSNAAVLAVKELAKPEVADETVLEGQKVTFTTKADPTAKSYQWQQLIDDEWKDIDGADENEYTTEGTEADQSKFRVIVDNGYVTKTSNAASLTVKELAKPQVSDKTVLEGQKATFTTKADSTAKSYQWQQLIDDEWKDIDGADKNEYTTEGTEADQSKFRVIVDNGHVNKTSDAASLTVKELAKPEVKDQTVAEGQKATFVAKADSDVKSYQWQQLINGKWQDINGATNRKYTTKGTESNRSKFRVVVSNSYVTKTSDVAFLTVIKNGNTDNSGSDGQDSQKDNSNAGQSSSKNGKNQGKDANTDQSNQSLGKNVNTDQNDLKNNQNQVGNTAKAADGNDQDQTQNDKLPQSDERREIGLMIIGGLLLVLTLLAGPILRLRKKQ